MSLTIFKNFIINATGILISRIFGLFRDIALALFLGASIYSDIFFVAMKTPAFFRRIVAEGAFSQAFLPNYSTARKKGVFTLRVLIHFASMVFMLCLLVTFFSNFFTKLFAFGFTKEMVELASPFVALNFWYLFFAFLSLFLSSLLNYKNRFFISSISSALFNLFIVIASFFLQANEPIKSLYYFSYAIVLSGLAQLILQFLALFKSRILRAIFLSTKKKCDLSNFYKNFFHGLLGSSAIQLSSYMDTFIASFLMSGSISYLYYANRVFQLPLAIFAIALAQVAFPKVLQQLRMKKEEKALFFMQKSFEYLSLLLIFASIIALIFAKEIIDLLFGRGNFKEEDVLISSLLLKGYILGLLPFGLQKLFSLWLYAKFKQKVAAKIAFKTLFLSVFTSLLLIYFIDDSSKKVLGIALASSFSAYYLLFASIKEFGFKNFLKLFSLKFWFLPLILLALLSLILIEYKLDIIIFLKNSYFYIKDINVFI